MAVVDQAPRLPHFDTLDFDDFHAEELPRLLVTGNGALAAGIAAGALVKSFAWRLTDDRSVTYVVGDNGIDGQRPTSLPGWFKQVVQ